MTKNPKRKTSPHAGAPAEPITLAEVLAALDRPGGLSGTRQRDLKSATKRVAILLGNEPAAIPLDMAAIGARLATVNPAAVGLTAKRFANIRSDFLAAVKASGVKPLKVELKSPLSPDWVDLFERLSGQRAHIGLSRLARYASAQGIVPEDVNDDVIGGFITAVREGSLHRKPDALHRQVSLIWNEAVRDPALGLQLVTVPSFRGPVERIDWALLTDAFKKDMEGYLSWCGVSDPFAADARSRALAARTLRLRRDQIHAAITALVKSRDRACHHPVPGGSDVVQQLQIYPALAPQQRGRSNEHLQLQSRQGACSDCVRVGESRRAAVRRTQASSRQDAGPAHGNDRQEQALSATVRRPCGAAAPVPTALDGSGPR